jgi:hypothetical protein
MTRRTVITPPWAVPAEVEDDATEREIARLESQLRDGETTNRVLYIIAAALIALAMILATVLIINHRSTTVDCHVGGQYDSVSARCVKS